MYIKVKVNTKSKKERVLKKQNDKYEVWLKEKPEKGNANKRLIEILSQYLKLPAFYLKIIKGVRQKNKIIKIKN